MMASHGWGDSEFSCLESLWTRESSWNYQAENASSGAYGIPQALPGAKMSEVADDWATNPSHPDHLGPELHLRPLRLPLLGLGPLRVRRLVLSRSSRPERRRRRPSPSETGAVAIVMGRRSRGSEVANCRRRDASTTVALAVNWKDVSP